MRIPRNGEYLILKKRFDHSLHTREYDDLFSKSSDVGKKFKVYNVSKYDWGLGMVNVINSTNYGGWTPLELFEYPQLECEIY